MIDRLYIILIGAIVIFAGLSIVLVVKKIREANAKKANFESDPSKMSLKQDPERP